VLLHIQNLEYSLSAARIEHQWGMSLVLDNIHRSYTLVKMQLLQTRGMLAHNTVYIALAFQLARYPM